MSSKIKWGGNPGSHPKFRSNFAKDLLRDCDPQDLLDEIVWEAIDKAFPDRTLMHRTARNLIYLYLLGDQYLTTQEQAEVQPVVIVPDLPALAAPVEPGPEPEPKVEERTPVPALPPAVVVEPMLEERTEDLPPQDTHYPLVLAMAQQNRDALLYDKSFFSVLVTEVMKKTKVDEREARRLCSKAMIATQRDESVELNRQMVTMVKSPIKPAITAREAPAAANDPGKPYWWNDAKQKTCKQCRTPLQPKRINQGKGFETENLYKGRTYCSRDCYQAGRTAPKGDSFRPEEVASTPA